MSKKDNTKPAQATPGVAKVKMFELMNIERGLNLLNGIGSVRLGMHRGDLSRPIGDKLSSVRKFMDEKEWKRLSEEIDRIERKHAITDEHGAPISTETGYRFSSEGFVRKEEELAKLKEKEKAAFEERQRLIDEYNELMKGESGIGLPMIPLSLMEKIEKDYEDRKLEYPFKTEVFDLLSCVIDRNA